MGSQSKASNCQTFLHARLFAHWIWTAASGWTQTQPTTSGRRSNIAMTASDDSNESVLRAKLAALSGASVRRDRGERLPACNRRGDAPAARRSGRYHRQSGAAHVREHHRRAGAVRRAAQSRHARLQCDHGSQYQRRVAEGAAGRGSAVRRARRCDLPGSASFQRVEHCLQSARCARAWIRNPPSSSMVLQRLLCTKWCAVGEADKEKLSSSTRKRQLSVRHLRTSCSLRTRLAASW